MICQSNVKNAGHIQIILTQTKSCGQSQSSENVIRWYSNCNWLASDGTVSQVKCVAAYERHNLAEFACAFHDAVGTVLQ